jgi:2-oxoglutarate dehydrogenase E2 component (dihydrolipoamide succinyltransferase)
MIVEIKVPSPGESISEVEIASWLVEDGDYVEKDQEIAEVESDKATLPLIAEQSGTIRILADTGKAIQVGTVVCSINTDGIVLSDSKVPSGEKAPSGGITPPDGKVPSSGKAPEAEGSVLPESTPDVRISPVAS